jgi:tripartite motif-containing protein 2/3
MLSGGGHHMDLELAVRHHANSGGSGSDFLDLSQLDDQLSHSVKSLMSGSGGQQTTGPLPAKSNIKRAKMIYNCKFGEFGVNEGQFTEPSGVCINANNDIIVADTNSHRIQIFDADGRFKFKFGECGKREGQLLYPNRVAVVKQTGDIVVTERSPTHQIQIYNQYGHFLRKFGANILQHPRGVCVDSKNRIVVVECKVMRVIIFDLMGNILHKFNCSKYLEFPNGCCCSNNADEIFISDNRAHCIKVFNYEGQFLRQIGGEGITNYPIGVGINANGEVLVADNHNNFNLTVFGADGELITALESKVKHAQCFDVGLMDDGSIVLASKDYRIYVYRYNSQQQNAIGSENSAANLAQQQQQLIASSLINGTQNNVFHACNTGF